METLAPLLALFSSFLLLSSLTHVALQEEQTGLLEHGENAQMRAAGEAACLADGAGQRS